MMDRLAWSLVALAAVLTPRAAIAQPISTIDVADMPAGVQCPLGQLSYGGYVFTTSSFGNPVIARLDQKTLEPVGSPLPFTGSGFNGATQAGGFGYFLRDNSPGTIVKVNLIAWEVVDELTLSIVRPYTATVLDGVLYVGFFGGSSSSVVRVDLSTFTEIGSALTVTGSMRMSTSFAHDGVVYMVTSFPTNIIKIDPAAWPNYTPLLLPDTLIYGMDVYKNQLVFAFNSGKIGRVDLASFSLIGSLDTIPDCYPWGFKQYDGYAYIGCDNYSPNEMRIVTWDLEAWQQLTPDLIVSGSGGNAMGTESAVVFSSNNKYGFTGSCYDPQQMGKWGPLLSRCKSTGLVLKGKTSRSKVTVTGLYSRSLAQGSTDPRGPVIKYAVTLTNPKNKTAGAFDRAGLVVALPPGTAYVKARLSPRMAFSGSKSNKEMAKTLSTPVYDANTNTLTWVDAPLAAGKRRNYYVYVKVLPAATSPLTFEAWCPNCPALSTQSNVMLTVKTKTK